MKKEEFVRELRERLQRVPQSDLDERISYYCEMIDDRMEDGLSEEDAVAAIGSVDSVAAQIMSEIPLTRLVNNRPDSQRKRGAGFYVLLILGAPLWFPLLIAAFAIVLAIFITLWALVISFFAIAVSLVAGAIATVPAAVIFMSGGNPAGCGFSVGAGLICLGIAILWFLLSIAIAKGVAKLMGVTLLGVKRSFIGKEA